MEVKLRARDGAGRLLKVTLDSGRTFTTPTFFPVYNPHQPVITPRELKEEFGWDVIITNAYIIWRDSRLYGEARERGIHGLLDFDGVVMMDSGAYQKWLYGDIEVTNEEIIEFQNEIKPDIGTFHDVIVPYEASRDEALQAVKQTLINAEVCKELGGPSIAWMATVQGSVHLDLVRAVAERLRELDFGYYALGGYASTTTQWYFLPAIDLTVEALKILPRDRPVHGWGIGHPAVFGLFVLAGVDTFDSASYALFAKDNRLMFPWGTERLEELEDIPYSKYLEGYTPKELLQLPREERVRLLAKHNLWIILNEIRAIREAIRGEYLFEYVQERVRAHPSLYEAYMRLLKEHGDYLEYFTPFSKKHGLFAVGEEFQYRPEVRRARKLLERVKSAKTTRLPFYGDVPHTLLFTYPFGQSHFPFFEEERPKVDPSEQVRDIIRYQWGVDVGEVRVETSRGKPRRVYKEGAYIGMIRPHDHLFVPSIEGARLLASLLPFPAKRVVVDEVAREPVSEGKSVFTKFVIDVDPELRAGEEVIVVDSEDNVLAVGKLVLTPREIEEFASHVAVKVRHGTKRS